MDLTHVNVSHVFARMLSTRPLVNLLVEALSYVETNLLYNLKKQNFKLLVTNFTQIVFKPT